MSEPFAPRLVSNQVKTIDITGYLFPWLAGRPLFVQVHGSKDIFLSVFSTKGKLVSHMALCKLAFDSIGRIDHMWEFLNTLPMQFTTGERLRVMVDPMVNEAGNTRFTEIYRKDVHGDDIC